jgi:streptogramin lyase
MTESTREIPEAVTVRDLELSELGSVHGVTCDSEGNVWFAHGEGDLICVEPRNGRIVRRFDGIGATSGTAFDGSHLWQITADAIVRLDPKTGAVERTIDRPEGVHCSGMAWVDGALWIGDYANRMLVKLDPETGRITKRLESDRLVTGVAWIDGQLWHGAWGRDEEPYDARLRRVDAESGAVLEELRMPDDWSVSGTGVDAEDRIWCGGSHGGGLRAVRRPRP